MLNITVVFLIITYCILDFIKTKRIQRFKDSIHNKANTTSYLNKSICIIKLVIFIAIIVLLSINRFIIKDTYTLSISFEKAIIGYILIFIVLLISIYDVKKAIKEERDIIEAFSDEEDSKE